MQLAAIFINVVAAIEDSQQTASEAIQYRKPNVDQEELNTKLTEAFTTTEPLTPAHLDFDPICEIWASRGECAEPFPLIRELCRKSCEAFEEGYDSPIDWDPPETLIWEPGLVHSNLGTKEDFHVDPSGEGRRKMQIQFENDATAGSAVDVIWVDESGKLSRPTVVEPGTTRNIASFANHQFVFKQNGQIIGSYRLPDFKLPAIPIILFKTTGICYFHYPHPKTKQDVLLTLDQIEKANNARWGLGNYGDEEERELQELYNILWEGTTDARRIALARIGINLLTKHNFGEPFTHRDAWIRVFALAYELGSMDALYFLGLQQEEMGNHLEALRNINCAAEAGVDSSDRARLMLGYRWRFGIPPYQRSCDQALILYERIARDVVWTPQILEKSADMRELRDPLSRDISPDLGEGEMQYHQDQANNGNLEHQTFLAQIFLFGMRGHAQNWPRAANLFEQAAREGDPLAQEFLGYMYWRGMHYPKNETKAKLIFEKYAESGSVQSQTYLGLFYLKGIGGPKNITAALHWLHLAGSRENTASAAALFILGSVYFDEADQVPRNISLALYYYKKSAALNHKGAKYQTGMMYSQGWGTERNCETALRYLVPVAEQVRHRAELDFANKAYLLGDYNESLTRYFILARDGYLNAQVNVAWLLSEQLGYEAKDHREQAYIFYEQAALHNDTKSLLTLGYYHWYGNPPIAANTSEEERKDTAIDYWYKAGSLGDSESLWNLGWCHQYGEGVIKNINAARKYYWNALEDPSATIPASLALLKMETELFLHRWAPSWVFCQWSLVLTISLCCLFLIR